MEYTKELLQELMEMEENIGALAVPKDYKRKNTEKPEKSKKDG